MKHPVPERHEPRAQRWWPAAVVAVAVAVTAVAVAVIAPDDTPSAAAGGTGVPTEPSDPSAAVDVSTTAPTPAAGPLGSLVVREGGAATATGVIVQPPGLPAMLCAPLPVAAVATVLRPGAGKSAPACSPLAVALDVDVRSLPRWTGRDGAGFTDGAVTVHGVWRDGELVVDSATAAADAPWPSTGEAWQVPCAAPDGGWVGGDAGGLDPGLVETAEPALAAELAAHPDRYHANWIAYPDGDPFAPGAPTGDFGHPLVEHTVMVVSTVEDPSTVHAHLAAVYPGNLCVTRVAHSTTDLDAIVARLGDAGESWVLDAHSLYAAVANSVFLELPVLDDAAVARIGADAAVLHVRPLVQPAG